MSTPVLVGVGVVTQREQDPTKADEPLALMIRAALASGSDSGVASLLRDVQRIYVPQGRWQYRDPAGAIAKAIGAANVTTVHSKVGVLQQTTLGDACERIAEGEIDVALVVGGEAGYRLRRAELAGVELNDTVLTGSSDVVMRPSREIVLETEVSSGLGHPAVGYYAIIESAFRAQHGWDIDAHRDRLAALYHQFSTVAASNPDAWTREPKAASSIRDPSETNPMLAFPYTRAHTTSWNVDQASALLFCSEQKADELGVARSRRVFPIASSESNHMVNLSARADLARCPGAQLAGNAALEHAETDAASLDLIELYSCFPIAVETFAAELGISLDRPLTFTGGMPFAGGPYNNFVFQATCRLAQLLRERPQATGLVSCVSGVLTKQGFGLWSASRGTNPFANIDVTDRVADGDHAKQVLPHFDGTGTIAGYTIVSGRPNRAIAVVDVADGTRAVAHSESSSNIAEMEQRECCGRRVLVTNNSFEFV